MINSNACFAYFNKIRGILFFKDDANTLAALFREAIWRLKLKISHLH